MRPKKRLLAAAIVFEVARAGAAMAEAPAPPPAQHKAQQPRWQPTWATVDTGQPVAVGVPVAIALVIADAEGLAIAFTAKDLPAGARLDVPPFPYQPKLLWTPTAADVGLHEITVTATDGQWTAPALIRLLVEPAKAAAPVLLKATAEDNDLKDLLRESDDEWTTFFMPGVSGAYYAPAAANRWGAFAGVSAEFLLAAWIHRNENRGPSHGRVYADLSILLPSRAGLSTALDVRLGLDLSIERNPKRQVLIPFYGLQTGAFVQKELSDHVIWEITPTAGLHVYSARNVFVVASAGYVLPFSGTYFDELRGLRLTGGVNVSFW